MPSSSYNRWSTARIIALDELENAHLSVGGSGRGRRYATQQINQAYAVMLSSQFQGYCRDLHSESVDHLVRSMAPHSLHLAVRTAFTLDRKLDRGNPNPGNIGSDFGRLGVALWPAVHALDKRNSRRQAMLEELNRWRNAIAHQDFDPGKLAGRSSLLLESVRRWRAGCETLAGHFDMVMRDHICSLSGTAPW